MRRGLILACSLLALSMASGCATAPRLKTAAAAAPTQTVPPPKPPASEARTRVDLLKTGEKPAPRMPEATAAEIAALYPEEAQVEATLPPQPIGQFIDTVFGQILETPYYSAPGVAERTDIVALGGAGPISKRAFFTLLQQTLKDYGLRLAIVDGAVRVQEAGVGAGSSSARIIRGRTAPDVPASSRYVVQFFPLKALNAETVVEILNDAYPDRGSVKFTVQTESNVLVISGSGRDVAAASALVNEIDAPRFAEGKIGRIQPVFWSAERLADAVARALSAEGYQVTIGDGAPPRTIAFLPVPFTNDVLVFSSEADVFARALYWAQELDRPSALGDQAGAFVYTVRNTSAAELGQLVAKLAPQDEAGGASASANGPAQQLRRPTDANGGNRLQDSDASAPQDLGRITIDPGGNRLIFRGTPSEFARIRQIMEELDTPPQQVLVELTIAEVTLTDDTRFGVEWFFQDTIANGSGTVTGDTRGGSVREAGGLGVSLSRVFSTSRVQATLNAIAENRNINVLSTPRLLARSGGEAEILVGSEVPIITSQRAANQQTGGSTDVLQTVQYRQTGVILNMRPVIYGDRVDIEIFQEVSNQEPNRTSSITSPVITNRSVTTQLSLREGYTAVIGGMIQDRYSRQQSGVPVLKDLPLIGQAFRTDSVSGGKVELLILVTPYIVSGDGELRDMAEGYSAQINRTLRRRGPATYTLLPWRNPFLGPRVHGAGPPPPPRGPLVPPPTPQTPVAQPPVVQPEAPSS